MAESEPDEAFLINAYGTAVASEKIGAELVYVSTDYVRKSWVYGLHGNNFVKTMLNIVKNQDSVSVVAAKWDAQPIQLI